MAFLLQSDAGWVLSGSCNDLQTFVANICAVVAFFAMIYVAEWVPGLLPNSPNFAMSLSPAVRSIAFPIVFSLIAPMALITSLPEDASFRTVVTHIIVAPVGRICFVFMCSIEAVLRTSWGALNSLPRSVRSNSMESGAPQLAGEADAGKPTLTTGGSGSDSSHIR